MPTSKDLELFKAAYKTVKEIVGIKEGENLLITIDSISDFQMGELNRLKSWLYHQRIKTRQEKDRVERKQEKETAKTKRGEEQPALFKF